MKQKPEIQVRIFRIIFYVAMAFVLAGGMLWLHEITVN